MKRIILFTSIISLMIISIFILGCAQAAVESAITDFKNAVNNDSVSEIQSALSPESDFYITATFSEFLDHFDGNRNVHYSNLQSTIEGANANTYANATYKYGDPGAISDDVWFWLKRQNTLFAFLFPDYKVYRYYDSADFTDPVWRKIQDKLE